jgi:hypothetical protein
MCVWFSVASQKESGIFNVVDGCPFAKYHKQAPKNTAIAKTFIPNGSALALSFLNLGHVFRNKKRTELEEFICIPKTAIIQPIFKTNPSILIYCNLKRCNNLKNWHVSALIY